MPLPPDAIALTDSPTAEKAPGLPPDAVPVSDSGFTEAVFPEQEEAVKEIAGPIEGITQGLVKGYAESAQGVNTKLLAVAKLANNEVFSTKGLQDNFRKNAAYWGQVANEASQKGGDNFVLNTIGGLPIGLAEFGATRNPISIVAAGATISALEDYGKALEKDPEARIGFDTLQAGMAGGAVTGATIGAVHVTGVGIDNLAKLVRKHGAQTVKNLFTAINGGDERMGQKALDLLSDPAYNKKEVLEGVQKFAGEQEERVATHKTQTKDMVQDLRQDRKDTLFRRDQDMDFEMRQRQRSLETDAKLKLTSAEDAIADLQRTHDQAVTDLRIKGPEELAAASEAMNGKIMAAKNAVQEHIQTVFTGMLRKIEGLKDTTGKAIQNNWNQLIDAYPEAGVSAEKILARIKSADSGENLFHFVVKDGQVAVTPKVSMPHLDRVAAQLEGDLNNALLSRGSREGGVSANTMRVVHDLFEAASVMPADKGAVLPGIGKIYGNLADAFHIRHYSDSFSGDAKLLVDDIIHLNGKYGQYKDKLSSVYSQYFKKEGEAVVPKVEEIFNRFDRGDTRFLSSLAKAEEVEGLAAEDKVFGRVKQMYENFRKVRSSEEGLYLSLKTAANRGLLTHNAAFNESLAKLRANKASLTAAESARISDTLFELKRANEVELKGIRDAFDEKIREMAKTRAEGLKQLRSEIAEAQLTLETKHMLRSFRPKSGTAHIFQNIGMYGAAGSGIGMATGVVPAAKALPLILGKGLMAVAASPRVFANVSRFALKNKETLKAATRQAERIGGAMHKSTLLKRLIAATVSR